MTWLVVWILVAKTVKLWPHFCRYPADLKFLPVMFAFGYFHGLIRIWTLLTIHKVRRACVALNFLLRIQ